MQAMDKDRPDNVEVLDGGRAMNFSRFVTRIQGGDLAVELNKHLEAIPEAMNQNFQDFRGTPTAELDVKFKFKMEKGVVAVVAEVKVKLPKQPASGGIFYIDAQNRFCDEDPRQLAMFPRR